MEELAKILGLPEDEAEDLLEEMGFQLEDVLYDDEDTDNLWDIE